MDSRRPSWDTIRSALEVARAGSLSGASKALGIHHATVLRHVEELEGTLNVVLFNRHAKGYALTTAGEAFVIGAASMEQGAAEIAHRAREQQEVAGKITVTSLSFLNDILVGAVASVHQAHPGLEIEVNNTPRKLRLDLAEAEIALRPGVKRPQELDYVVLAAPRLSVSLFGTPAFRDRQNETAAGPLALPIVAALPDPSAFAAHLWWERQSFKAVPVLRTNDIGLQHMAMREGLGVGFLPTHLGRADPALVELAPPREDWAEPVWICTHRETHRTARIQAMVSALRSAALGYSYHG